MDLDSARGSNQEQAAIIISLEHNVRILEQEKVESVDTYVINTVRFLSTNLAYVSLREARVACKASKDALATESIRMAEVQSIREALEQELGKMKKHDADREAKYVPADLCPGLNGFPRLRETTSSMVVLQERFDAQAITLRLSKEHCGDVQV